MSLMKLKQTQSSKMPKAALEKGQAELKSRNMGPMSAGYSGAELPGD